MENEHDAADRPKRKPGRPPGSHKKTPSPEPAEQKMERKKRSRLSADRVRERAGADKAAEFGEIDDEALAYALDEEDLSPFSRFLRHVLRHDRPEIGRLALAIGVNENTIYRWMNGNVEPRVHHLKELLNALPEHRNNLTYAINRSFPDLLSLLPTQVREVPKEIYRRITNLIAANDDDDVGFWQITQALFNYILLHLDAERQGLCVTYAKLMPPQEDGLVHSLREFSILGSHPWVYTNDIKGYLGGTTLAGYAAAMLRMQVWSATEKYSRLPVEIDDHERSACAVPIVRGSRIGGVLIISSTQPTFFDDSAVCEIAVEYAQLLSLGIHIEDFVPASQLSLRAMPKLKVQREYINNSAVKRTLDHVQFCEISHQQAGEKVECEMEQEFEEMARIANNYARMNLARLQDTPNQL